MKKIQQNDKKATKKTIQLRKSWSFAWKKMSFFTQKDHPASQKAEVLHDKMSKNWQIYQKNHPAPQKTRSFAWKNGKKLTKKTTQPHKKPEVLHEKLKIILPMGILKKKFSTPNFTKFLNP